MIDFTQFPSPCYIMEEELLRKNLSLIKSVADRAGVEIILAFKSFAMWHVWRWKSSEVRHILIHLHIQNRISRKSCVAVAILLLILWHSSNVSIR